MSKNDLSVNEILDSMKKANEIHLTHRGKDVSIERAIFLSWHCELADCKFCYMSTQESEPLAIRRVESVLSEAIITDALGWNLEFLSAGYGYSGERLDEIIKDVSKIHEVWLNIGGIPENVENIQGVVGSVETVNRDLHSSVAPNKSLDETFEMLKEANSIGLETGITVILGIGETLEDLDKLLELIGDLDLDRITFYSLNPQEGTIYEGLPFPSSLYYSYVVSQTRINFPDLDIFTGIWTDKIPMLGNLMVSGSDAVTKFPMEIIGSEEGRSIKNEIKSSNRNLKGDLVPKNDFIDKVRENLGLMEEYDLKESLNMYFDKLEMEFKL